MLVKYSLVIERLKLFTVCKCNNSEHSSNSSFWLEGPESAMKDDSKSIIDCPGTHLLSFNPLTFIRAGGLSY